MMPLMINHGRNLQPKIFCHQQPPLLLVFSQIPLRNLSESASKISQSMLKNLAEYACPAPVKAGVM